MIQSATYIALLIGLLIVAIISYIQYKNQKIQLKFAVLLPIAYMMLAVIDSVISINLTGMALKAYRLLFMFILLLVISFYGIKSKQAMPKQLIKALLIGFSIGILLVILLIIGVVFYMLIIGK